MIRGFREASFPINLLLDPREHGWEVQPNFRAPAIGKNVVRVTVW